jgi:outer membrane lipoprotein-sorting protein
MRLLLSASAVSALLVTVAALQGQTLSVDEIIAKNISARGGVETLKGTTSVRTTGKGVMQGAEMTVSSVNKRPYFFRNESSLPGQKRILAFDGENLWMALGDMPPQLLPPGPQLEAMKQTSQIDSPLLDYKAKGTRIELGQPLAEEGRTLHHLIVTPKGAPAMHYYIDAVTNLEAKMVIEVEENGQTTKMEMRFSDFTNVQGRQVPFTVTQFVNGKQAAQVKYSSVEFNVPVDDSLFRMPK